MTHGHDGDGASRVDLAFALNLYGDCERLARERIEIRDPDDWPVVAVALMLDLPIWTEDRDLFGSGIPTANTTTKLVTRIRCIIITAALRDLYTPEEEEP